MPQAPLSTVVRRRRALPDTVRRSYRGVPIRPNWITIQFLHRCNRCVMRPGPARRPHGRDNGNNAYRNRQQIPHRSQTIESNGPDIKIRGNPHQIFERYVALAREASTSGDRFAAENLYQHAEHYFRVMNAANEGHQPRVMPPTAAADLETESAEGWFRNRGPGAHLTKQSAARLTYPSALILFRENLILAPLALSPGTGNREMLWGGRQGHGNFVAACNRWSAAMPQPNDLSRSLVALDQNSTIIAVVELSGRVCERGGRRALCRRGTAGNSQSQCGNARGQAHHLPCGHQSR